MFVLKQFQLLISSLILSKVVCKPCIVDLEDPVGFISAEGLDNNNNNLSAYCDWNLYVPYYYVVQLQFVYINIKKNPGCDEDFIAIHDDSVKIQLCGSYVPPAFQSQSRYVSVKFQTSSDISNYGFNLTYAHIEEPICGSDEVSILGFLAPADFDGDGLYDNDMDCIWKLVALKRNQLLQLYFLRMDLQSSESCELDYVKILDNDDRSLGVFCGTVQPPLIESRTAVLHINFHSDLSVNGEGFLAMFAIIDKDRQCGGLLTQAPGIINTADRNNDGNYDVHLYCVWAMIAPANTSIELQFLSFDVEYVTNCIFDNVQVYGVDFYRGRYCGTKIPTTIHFNSRVLFLHFYSDFEIVSKGFSARYRYISDDIMTTEFSTSTSKVVTTQSYHQTTTIENSDGQISTTNFEIPVSENHSQFVQNFEYLHILALANFAYAL